MFCSTVRFPTEILRDRGGEFAELDQFVCLHKRAAAYTPQCSSRLERKNQEIRNLCRANEISSLEAVLLLNDEYVELSAFPESMQTAMVRNVFACPQSTIIRSLPKKVLKQFSIVLELHELH